MYAVKAPGLARWMVRDALWKIPCSEKTAYLTFDDGPTPNVTEWVLDLLKEKNAKATFFLVGQNAEKHPELVRRIFNEGHSVGNHTYSHPNGWKIKKHEYLLDVEKGAEVLNNILHKPVKYFRPPYGRLSFRQYHHLKNHYRIAMWDILSGDFDSACTREEVFANVFENICPGSVIVFHDSFKCEARLRYALPKTLETLSEQGYTFDKLP